MVGGRGTAKAGACRGGRSYVNQRPLPTVVLLVRSHVLKPAIFTFLKRPGRALAQGRASAMAGRYCCSSAEGFSACRVFVIDKCGGLSARRSGLSLSGGWQGNNVFAAFNSRPGLGRSRCWI